MEAVSQSMKQPVSNYDRQVDMAAEIFLQYDQEVLIRKFRLEADDRWIRLTYLNSLYRISRQDGHIEQMVEQWEECRNFNTVLTIYDLLCYSGGGQIPSLTGQWCTVGNFVVTGVTNTETFTRKYAALFQGRLEALKTACETLGGVLQPRMAGADVTCRIPVTDFFPVLLQFWDGDEEFPPRLILLWDRSTDQFLHFETTFYLQGDLLGKLIRLADFSEK